eukprot:8494062-Heterocapsa_arctica.AAC.1
MSDLLDIEKEKSDVWHAARHALCHRACDVPLARSSGRGTATDIEVVILDKSEELTATELGATRWPSRPCAHRPQHESCAGAGNCAPQAARRESRGWRRSSATAECWPHERRRSGASKKEN